MVYGTGSMVVVFAVLAACGAPQAPLPAEQAAGASCDRPVKRFCPDEYMDLCEWKWSSIHVCGKKSDLQSPAACGAAATESTSEHACAVGEIDACTLDRRAKKHVCVIEKS